MSEEEVTAMRTDEGFKDYMAKKLRDLNNELQELRTAFEDVLEVHNHTSNRLAKGDARMERIEASLGANTDATKEILNIVTALKGGKTILGWFGSVAKWAGGLAIAWAAIAAVFHTDKLPWK